ncbi:MAG: LPP20 family lipoprotein [Colwellia sp.]|nr:LPP20 family lipoprotein [Colwellia sp.]
MKAQKFIIVAAMTTIIAACGSSAKKTEPEVKETNSLTTGIPAWVLNPVVEDGIAATDCVKFSGNLSIDQKMATANGRLSLAQQIETRVEGLDKTYANRTDSNEELTTGATFSSVSKQLTKQTLSGSRAIKSDIIDIAGKQHFCVLTTLSPSATKELFNALVKGSKRSVNPQDEKFLYQEFKAHKAEQSLEKEIQRLTN